MATHMQVITDNLDLWTSALLTKSTAGRGNNGRVEAYGIKKLRELILELAICGKLVPQDPNDESASCLLANIAEVKKQLIKDCKVKEQKTLPFIGEDKKQKQLPKGWAFARLGDVLNVINGRAYKKDEMLQEGTPLLRVGNLFTSKEWYYSNLELEPEKYIDNGDLIYAWSASFGPFIWNGGKVIYHYHIWKLELYDKHKFDKYYLHLYLSAVTEKIKASGSGIAMIHMTKERMEKLDLSVPPLAEQYRIVAKVDELMALCDKLEQQQTNSIEAHQTLVETLLGTLTNIESQQELNEAWNRIAEHFDTLFTTEQSIDQLKQTILQLAVMGKLVPQDPDDEPASVLLKHKKTMSIPFRIPDSWAWARVDEIAQTRLGKMLDKAKNKGTPVRYLRNINVRWFDFDLSDVKEMRFEDSELEEFALHSGDVLICEGGYPGRAAVWDEREANIYFQKAIHRVRFKIGVNPHYFVNVLRESADIGRLNSYFTGAGIQHFTGKGLMSFLVPLPPLAEQHRIVAKVDELMTLCDNLKSHLTDAQTTQIHLADTIVEQAVA